MKKKKKGRKAWVHSRHSCVDSRPAGEDFEVIVDYRLNVSCVKQI